MFGVESERCWWWQQKGREEAARRGEQQQQQEEEERLDDLGEEEAQVRPTAPGGTAAERRRRRRRCSCWTSSWPWGALSYSTKDHLPRLLNTGRAMRLTSWAERQLAVTMAQLDLGLCT